MIADVPDDYKGVLNQGGAIIHDNGKMKVVHYNLENGLLTKSSNTNTIKYSDIDSLVSIVEHIQDFYQ